MNEMDDDDDEGDVKMVYDGRPWVLDTVLSLVPAFKLLVQVMMDIVPKVVCLRITFVCVFFYVYELHEGVVPLRTQQLVCVVLVTLNYFFRSAVNLRQFVFACHVVGFWQALVCCHMM